MTAPVIERRKARKTPAAPAYAELQAMFQRALLEGDDTVLAEILDSSKEKRDVLLGVYRNAYLLRLRDFLINDYPALHAFCGENLYDRLAWAYIKARPSQHPNARWYGQRLSNFLSATKPYSDRPELAEIASFECALADAFDAADARAVSMADLASIAPDDWPHLVFTPHPSARRLNLETNAIPIWRAVQADEPLPKSAALPETARVLVFRANLTSKFRVLAYDEAMMWDEAVKGVTFGVLCELLATYGGEDDAPMRAAMYLKGWIENGLLAHED